MDWLFALFDWIARLPRIAALRASVVVLILAVRDDLRRLDTGEIRPDSAVPMSRTHNACLCAAHILLAAYIHNRALSLAGVRVFVPRQRLPTSGRRAVPRAVIEQRLRELERRLKRADQIARHRAAEITQTRDALCPRNAGEVSRSDEGGESRRDRIAARPLPRLRRCFPHAGSLAIPPSRSPDRKAIGWAGTEGARARGPPQHAQLAA